MYLEILISYIHPNRVEASWTLNPFFKKIIILFCRVYHQTMSGYSAGYVREKLTKELDAAHCEGNNKVEWYLPSVPPSLSPQNPIGAPKKVIGPKMVPKWSQKVPKGPKRSKKGDKLGGTDGVYVVNNLY